MGNIDSKSYDNGGSSTGVEKVGGELRSNLRRKCPNIIFWTAAILLTMYFFHQVSESYDQSYVV